METVPLHYFEGMEGKSTSIAKVIQELQRLEIEAQEATKKTSTSGRIIITADLENEPVQPEYYIPKQKAQWKRELNRFKKG